jgi:recombination protein RecT
MAEQENNQVAKTDNQAVGPAEGAGGAIASTEQLKDLRDAAKLVQKYAKAVVGDARAAEFAAQVSIMAQQNPKIRDCDPLSVVKSMMACVRLNLMPNTPEQYVALIPYGRELQFQVMYKGLAQLAYNSGIVNKIDAQLVFPEDEWSIEEGTDRRLVHKWTAESLQRDRTKVEDALFVYATAVLNTGEKTFVIMTQSEVQQIKTQSVKAIKDDTPWVKWPTEQYKKTAVKRLTKLLPKSDTDNRLAYAAQADSLQEAGKLGIDYKTGTIIEGQVVETNDDRRKRLTAAAQAKEQEMNGSGHKAKAVKNGEAE